VQSLSDVRSLGMIVFGVIALLVTWSSVRVVQTNYDLEKQMSAIQQQNDVQGLANNNQKLKNEYYTTDAYLELSARRHFNKAAPGEKLLIVPKEVALAHSIELPKPKTAAENLNDTIKASGPSLQRNFNAWMTFLFHRQAAH
jgi:cell division protein FtsB